jgi:peptide/nickel transport system permease protein
VKLPFLTLISRPAGQMAADAETAMQQAGQWRLIWWRFRHHRLAMIGAGVLGLLVTLAVFADFIAPVSPHDRDTTYVLGPPMVPQIHDQKGFGMPFVHGVRNERDPKTLRMITAPDTEVRRYVQLFAKTAEPYHLWGVVPMQRKLFGLSDGSPLHLLGTDNLGRDVFARSIFALRVSLSVGVAGVLISFVLGLLIGGLAGYLGGSTDFAIMRAIELIMSIPTLPLWMTLAAIVPKEWTAIQAYFAITILLGLLGWTGLARDVRSKIISLRDEDYVVAARLSGVSDWTIIRRHLLPATTSYVIVSLTLAFPGIILGETALSFLGFGLRPPVVSLGVLLENAQNIRTIAQSPWVMSPVVFVILIVLAFSFLGDGLRDAADPYSDKA